MKMKCGNQVRADRCVNMVPWWLLKIRVLKDDAASEGKLPSDDFTFKI